jgi:hypothetical protein
MKQTLLSIIAILLLVSCDDGIYIEPFTDLDYQLNVDARLPMDDRGFYHLTINNQSNQTIHRLSGRLLKNGKEPNPPEKVFWESSHMWVLTDSIGYIIRRTIDSRGRWSNVDTLVVRGFGNQSVPTINCCSYSGTNGEINTIIAPIREMKGDTLIIRTWFYTHNKITKIILK